MAYKIDTSWKWGYSYCGRKLRYIGSLDNELFQCIWAVRWSDDGEEAPVVTNDEGLMKDSMGMYITKNPAPKVRMWTWVRHFPVWGRTMCVGDLYSDETTALNNRPNIGINGPLSELLGPFPIDVEGIE